MNTPPPLPGSQPPALPGAKKPFSVQAAQLCLWSPIIALGLGFFTSGVLKNSLGGSGSSALMIIAFTNGVIVLIGLIFGLVALIGIRKHGAKDILGRAITGIILNSLFVAGAVYTTGIAAKRKADERSLKQVDAEVQKLREGFKQSFDEEGGIKADPEKLENFRRALEKGSEEATGDVKLALQAGASFTARMQAASGDYQAALKHLESLSVLDVSNVTQKEEFQPRREAVQNFLKANEDFKSFVSNAEKTYAAELRKLMKDEKTIERTLVGYRATASKVNPLVVRIRETDEQLGQGMLGIIDLLESHWGSWNYNKDEGGLRFKEDADVDKYNAFLTQINTASELQLQLQKTLVERSTAPRK